MFTVLAVIPDIHWQRIIYLAVKIFLFTTVKTKSAFPWPNSMMYTKDVLIGMIRLCYALDVIPACITYRRLHLKILVCVASSLSSWMILPRSAKQLTMISMKTANRYPKENAPNAKISTKSIANQNAYKLEQDAQYSMPIH